MNRFEFLVESSLNEILSEETINNKIYGYHVTSLDNWNEIKIKGLKIGDRTMQGRGLYAFYNYDHAIRYAMKGEISKPIIIKFEVVNPDELLILNMDVAKFVFGNNKYHLIKQIDNYFYDGFEGFYNEFVKKVHPEMTVDELKNKLNDIELNNTESNQRFFLFNLIPSRLNNRLDIIWDGNYGIEFRINDVKNIEIISYKELDSGKEINTNILDRIPNTEEFKPLKDFILSLKDVDSPKKHIYDKMLNSRNNKDFEYYSGLYELIKKF